MRAAALVALLVVGCTAGPGATPDPATPSATIAPATPSAATTTAPPTAPPTASPVANTVYTADDEEIAKLIRAGAAEAIPQLRQLSDSDPQQLEELFLPLGLWIEGQKTGVGAYTPSSCTTAAVALFLDGLNQYDYIREKFLAWRDWGAHGHAFPPGAPRDAVATFEQAVVELEAHCTA